MSRYLILLSVILLFSCGFGEKNESNLSAEDLAYIQDLVPFEEGEEIELFESNAGWKGLKVAGNIITNKGLASYWIEDDSEVHYASYAHIDSLKPVDKVRSLSYASYLIVYPHDQDQFKVYVDADSTRTWTFFERALKNWEQYQD